MIGATGFLVISLQRVDACVGWSSANAAFARNAARAQGEDPEGAALDRLIDRYENRFTNERPEGC
jgi:hypothetical protein